MRKYKLDEAEITSSTEREIDFYHNGTVGFTSAHPQHPIENLFDKDLETFWSSGRDNATEQILISFDAPCSLTRIVYEVIERDIERTQEIHVELSTDGELFRRMFVQDYVFSPSGATYEKQEIKLEARDVAQIRLTVIPNKNGVGRAKLTSLRVFAWDQVTI